MVEINQPGPDKVFFAYELCPRLGEELEGPEPFPGLTEGHGFVRHALRSLVSHPQFLKEHIAFMGCFPGFLAQVQFQVDFREVKMAESEVILVARFSAAAPRRVEHFNRPAVFPAKIVEVSNVVIGLSAQKGELVFIAERASLLVEGLSAREIVQRDQAHGHVRKSGD